MQAAPVPANEAARLSALRGLDVLDTVPEERFDRITRVARRLLGADIALVSLVDEDRQWFKSRDGLDVAETSRDISFCGHAIHDDDVMVVADAPADPRFADNPLVTGDPSIRFYAGCPLTVGDGHRVGTLCVIAREPRELEADDAEVLRDLAAIVERELQDFELATTDELTGLTNRRGLLQFGRQVLAAAARLDRPVSLLFLDVDGLKRVNDVEGHAAGDALLRDFSALLVDGFRACDVVARIGGDEFCVLASDTGAEAAGALIARAEDAMARARPPLSASIGLAVWEPGTPESIESLLERADSAMYEVKRARQRGRD